MRLKGLWSTIAQAAAKADSILAAYAAAAFGDSDQSDNAEKGGTSARMIQPSSLPTKQTRKLANSRRGAASAAAATATPAGKKDKGRPR